MKLIGIDLGWQSQPSGVCILLWRVNSLHLLNLTRLATIPDVLNWIDAQVDASESAIVAVDAPTLISNATGMRQADRLAHRYFGRYHAGCYPANLSLPFAQRTVEFGRSLEARGFMHAPQLQPSQSGRFQIEVFPHPAIVHLFNLDRILKYKKGRLADRAVELLRYRQYILELLPQLEPPLQFTDTENWIVLSAEMPKSGAALKAVEDQLDSLICAYVAAYWWYWGPARNLVVGPEDPAVCAIEGYIIVPKRCADSTSPLG